MRSTPTTRTSRGRTTTATATASWTTSPSSMPAWARRGAAASRVTSPSGRTRLPSTTHAAIWPAPRATHGADPRHLRARIQHGPGEPRRGRHRRGVRPCGLRPARHLHHRRPGLALQLGDLGGRLVERPAGRHAARAVPARLPLPGRLGQPGRARLHHQSDHRQGRPALAPPERHPAGDQDQPAGPGDRHAQSAGHRTGLVVRPGRPGGLLPGPRLRPDGGPRRRSSPSPAPGASRRTTTTATSRSPTMAAPPGPSCRTWTGSSSTTAWAIWA